MSNKYFNLKEYKTKIKSIAKISSYKGDRLITEDDEFIQIVKDEANPGFYELVLPEVRLEDAGEYRCVASNKYSDESCSCIVNVISKNRHMLNNSASSYISKIITFQRDR